MPECTNAGPANLAALKTAAKAPSHDGETSKKRGQSNTRRARDQILLAKDHPEIDCELTRIHNRRETLPQLASIPLSRIMAATGFSKRYASMIRPDLYTPHPVQCQKLEELKLLHNETNGG